jgi:hypothetical protein
VLGGRAELGLSDLPRLVVAEACFKEALRLHPPVGMINRCVLHMCCEVDATCFMCVLGGEVALSNSCFVQLDKSLQCAVDDGCTILIFLAGCACR